MSRCHLISKWLRFWTITNLFNRSSAFQSVLFDGSIEGIHRRSLPAARWRSSFVSGIEKQRNLPSFRRLWRSRPPGLRMVELYRNDAEVSFVRTYSIALSRRISSTLQVCLKLKYRNHARGCYATGYRTPWVRSQHRHGSLRLRDMP